MVRPSAAVQRGWRRRMFVDKLAAEFLDIDEDGFRPYDGDCDDEDPTIFLVRRKPSVVNVYDEDGDGFAIATALWLRRGYGSDDRDDAIVGAVAEAVDERRSMSMELLWWHRGRHGLPCIEDVCYPGYEG